MRQKSTKTNEPKAVKVIAREEDDTLQQLRQAIRELPLAELTKLKQTGLSGQPLHRALGFSSEKHVAEWLAKDASLSESSSADESSSQASESENDDKPWRSNRKPDLSEENSTSESEEDEEEEEAPRRVLKKKVEDPWLVAEEKTSNHKTESNSRSRRSDSEGSSSFDGDSSSDGDNSDAEGTHSSKAKKKRSRKAPAERPSNIQVSRKRDVVPVPKFRFKSLDPRFSNQEVDINLHRKRYAFLEEHRDKEIEQLRDDVRREMTAREIKGRKGRRMRKMTDEELAERRKDLTRLEQHKADSRRAQMYQSKLSEIKHEQKALVDKGIVREPRIISQKDKKKLKMDVRFEELEKRHKLERFMDKKRREQETKSRKANSKGPQLGV